MSLGAGEQSVRVLVANGHPVYLAGLRAILESIPVVDVVGDSTNATAAIDAARALRPDVVVLDSDVYDVGGVETAQKIISVCPEVGVLMLTRHDNVDSLRAAMQAGVGGYLPRTAGRDELARAVEAVNRGEIIFGSYVARKVRDHFRWVTDGQVPFPDLTSRERAVLQLVADGLSTEMIARQLCLSTKTVRNHLSRIFAKINVESRTEAAVRARRAGLGN